jgi:hypothetical protein
MLTRHFDKAIADEDIRAALLARYEIAMKYFGIDPQYSGADLALRLLAVLFPAFDFKPKSRSGRPKHAAWKLRELHRRVMSGEWKLSSAASRAEGYRQIQKKLHWPTWSVRGKRLPARNDVTAPFWKPSGSTASARLSRQCSADHRHF